MRLALIGATLVVAAYATLTHVTYLRNDGYAADLPEYRRIDVRSTEDCAEVVARADRTLGPSHGIVCEPVPRLRHWANLARDAYDRREIANVALNALSSEAVAGARSTALR